MKPLVIKPVVVSKPKRKRWPDSPHIRGERQKVAEAKALLARREQEFVDACSAAMGANEGVMDAKRLVGYAECNLFFIKQGLYDALNAAEEARGDQS